MAIYLDSASADELRQAVALGFVVGVTTNPALLAGVDDPPERVVLELCDLLNDGLVFYQLTASTVEEREKEARRVAGLRPGRIGLKIPATTENMSLLTRLVRDGTVCAVTALFSAHQAFLACEAGAHYLVPYVNRSTRRLGDGVALIEEIAQVVRHTEASTEILAASFHSLPEVVAAVRAGTDHVTVPFNLLKALGDHSLSQQAIEEFAKFV